MTTRDPLRVAIDSATGNFDLTDDIVAAITRHGLTVLTGDDLEWGTCYGEGADEPGVSPHHVSLSLCAGCLEYDPE